VKKPPAKKVVAKKAAKPVAAKTESKEEAVTGLVVTVEACKQ
jgi:hypothetical protein